MKSKLLKKLRDESKENVYLSQSKYYSESLESGKITIIYKTIDVDFPPFGLTTYFYNPDLDIFEQDMVVHYNTVEEALPDLQKARHRYILDTLHCDYRTFSKGEQKKQEIEIIKQQEYQKYLQQF
jgi:hypothetical protein